MSVFCYNYLMSFEFRQRLMAEAILVKDSAIRKICVAERCFGSVLVQSHKRHDFIYVFHKGGCNYLNILYKLLSTFERK